MTQIKSHCPTCGSTDIQLRRSVQTTVNWGRAVAGWALFGVVAGAVGAVTGKDRENIANCCLNCGTTWRAEDLYKVRQSIKELTGASLDLSLESHRDYLSRFVEEIINPYSDSMKILEKKRKSIHNEEKEALNCGLSCGCSLGCLPILIFIAAISEGLELAGEGCYIFSFFCFVGIPIGVLIDKARKPKIEEKYRRKLAPINR